VLMAWEESPGLLSEPLARIAESRPEAVTLIVGPEGGFSAEEAGLARRSGASLVSLGPRVLRAETAAIALAALVLHAGGDLDSVVPATLA
jgi:16S rRNA (uracil1498-N3)-methyltransferase